MAPQIYFDTLSSGIRTEHTICGIAESCGKIAEISATKRSEIWDYNKNILEILLFYVPVAEN